MVSLCSMPAQAASEVPTVKPKGKPWASGDGFRFGLNQKQEQQARQSLSGIACTLNSSRQRVCLMVFDEGVQAHFATLGQQALTADPQGFDLRNQKSAELDAEGAATDGTYFYVTGSHSAKRDDCESAPGRRHVIRFRLDPETGRAKHSPSGELDGYAQTGRLWSVMQSQPELKGHLGEHRCLGAKGGGGVNIEGLAVKGQRLYFGFRGPAKQRQAIILAVDAAALFGGGNVKARVTQLEVGKGRGIRDMVATESGLLLLVGPDDDPSNQERVDWMVAWWDGESRTSRPLARFDLDGVQARTLNAGTPRVCDDARRAKPEAMTVLEETPQTYRLLVLSDGLCDGGALEFEVKR